MAVSFPKLFEPGRIGKLEIKNRIVMVSMDLEFHTKGYIGDEHIAFYAERAKGGAGMIIFGGAATSPLGNFGPNTSLIDNDDKIPGYRRLVQALRKYDLVLVGQCFHAGKDGVVPEGMEPIAPSPIPSRFTRRTPREMTKEDIEQVIQEHAEAARRFQEAGCDAVEILCSSGYLVSQFFSPVTNHRTDEYGGPLENRARFAFELIQAVRRQVGPDFPVLVRHTAHDFIPGGHTLIEAQWIAQRFEELGAAAINVQVAWEESRVPSSFMVVPRGAFAYLAKGIKDAVNIPVMAANRINDPFVAEEIIRDGKADFVAIGRPLLADPEFAIKAKEGRVEDIRPCIACNQACIDNIFTFQPCSCMVNPRAGRELEWVITPVNHKKRVVVVGGGPGGMEAARMLKTRGHEVILLEQSERLGGQFNWAAICPPKDEFGYYVRHMQSQLEKLNVDVRLGQKATAQTVLQEKPDAVIVATGASPRIIPFKGVDRPIVTTAFDVLDGKAKVGKRVVIIGAGGVGCDTALYLASRYAISPAVAVFLANFGAAEPAAAFELTRKQRPIALVEIEKAIARDIGRTTRWIMVKEVHEQGIRVMTETRTEEITDQGVWVSHNGDREFLEADTVIISVGGAPRADLYQELEGKVPELYLIGDAKRVRDGVAAIYEAEEVALKI